MGIVYRAHDEHLNRNVAIKILPQDSLADDTSRQRFRKEAHALSKLNHPNVASVFDFDSEGGVDFLVEELIPGTSLDEKLLSRPLSERQIVSLGSQLCEGLASAHEQQIIHRDLKPGNLRITPDDRLKILDFGLAKVLHAANLAKDTDVTESFTEPEHVSGMLPYMAPEQLLNENLDTRTDIWSVGCVLYEMATGQRPFAGTGVALADLILHQQPTNPSKLNHRISLGLEAIILQCLEKDPARRYASAREIAVDLHRLDTGTLTRALAARRRALLRRATPIVALLSYLSLAARCGTGCIARRPLPPAVER